jgi:hypothetical protein
VKPTTRKATSRAGAASKRPAGKPARAAKPAATKARGTKPAATKARGAKPAATKARSAKPAGRASKSARGLHPGKARVAKPARSAKPARPAKPSRATRSGKTRAAQPGRWLAFVERHGIVLASARGPVPSVAEAVAGQPIIGSWWAHPKGKAIFTALSEIDDSDDVRCFKLVDGKVTFVHRRMWPALARLAGDGVLAPARVASIQQEHMPTGEHRNMVTPFPDWVPDDVALAASALTLEAARAELGSWV